MTKNFGKNQNANLKDGIKKTLEISFKGFVDFLLTLC